jgi:predicted DCC family thiol-disulfide oxidoreductase YuxK
MDVVIFDGVCHLCASSVQFILRHERAPMLFFASVQSPAGAGLMRTFGLDPGDVKTVVFIENGTAFVRSEAALRIACHLRQPWRMLAAVTRLIPHYPLEQNGDPKTPTSPTVPMPAPMA